MDNNVYRNQTSTLTQIQMLATMRITTVQEAVAFLRAMQPINTQIAQVLQRASLTNQQRINREQLAAIEQAQPQTVEAAPAPVEPEKTFVPEDLSSDEGYSEAEVEAKVSKLRRAGRAKKNK